MTPQRIQLSRRKGYRKPEGAIVVARPSKWGNPFRVGSTNWVPIDTDGRWSKERHEPLTVEQAVECFRLVSRYDLASYGPDYFAELRGHDLACWCRLDQPCHADVLLELANS